MDGAGTTLLIPRGDESTFPQVAAKLQEAEQRLRDQEVVLRALTLERDQALQALRDHGLGPEQEVPVSAPVRPCPQVSNLLLPGTDLGLLCLPVLRRSVRS